MKKILVGITAFAALTLFAGVASAATIWNVPGDNTNTCTIGDPSCSTIQGAVTAASTGDTVKVAAGSYSENVNITKSLTIDGAQAGNAVSGRTFASGSESTVSGAAEGTAVFTINAADVTIDGFSITDIQPAFSALGIAVKASDATIQNNIIENITTADTGSNGTAQGIYMAAANDGAQILNNEMTNIDSYKSAKGILFGDNSVGDGSTNATVEGNTISNVESAKSGAYGISFGNTTNAQSGIVISGNTINGLLSGGWVHAIGVEGNAPSVNINHNTISNLTASTTADVVGVWIESEDTSFTSATVNNNSLAVGSTIIGLGVDPTLTGGTVSGTCNWWGDASGPSGVATGTGSEVSSGATYLPWLTTSDLNGSCNGGLPTPSVTTGTATNVTTSDATMNATNGPVAADDGASFWVSTSPIDTSSPNIPAGVYSTPVLPGVIGAGASFQDQLSLVTTNGIVTGGNPGNMPAITPGTTYYYVAWVNVGGTWYPGNQESVIIPTPVVTPTVTTNSATGETTSSATLNGTDGSVNADETSFWWGTTPLTGLTPGGNVAEFPTTGWMHDTGLASVTAGSSFSENVSSLTQGQTYYFVAWVEVDGTWYPGQVLSFVVPMTAGSCPANTVQAGTALQTVTVDSSSDSPMSSVTLASGQPYLLVASGTWQNNTTNTSDAMYTTLSLGNWTTYQEGYDTTPYFLGPNEFNLEVNGAFANWGPFSVSHNYTLAYTGTGAPATFMVFDGNSNSGTSGVNDSWYGDNSGTLSVAIYECVVPPPPANACSNLTSAPAGYTLLDGTTANESVTLAPDTMFVSKGNGNNTIKGGAGNYIICTGSGNDSINLGAGSDTITDSGGNNTVSVGAGNDNITLNGSGNNVVTTGNGNEMITTGSGNDTITTGNGTSVINGGNGNNVVKTGTGSETITTGSGNDTITTANTGNTINAGGGNNTIHQ